MTIRASVAVAAGLAALAAAEPAVASEHGVSRIVDFVWIATAAALVFLMQAGFALLEAGNSRGKNAVNVMMKNVADVCLGSLVFFLVGYGLMFGANPTGFVGMSRFMDFRIGPADGLQILFQTLFAATAATIVSGAMAERTRFPAYLIAVIGITGLIYPVYGSWVWSGGATAQGWLAQLGFIDFAGASVVHAIGGWCALAGAIVVGPRLGRFGRDGSVRTLPGHNLLLVGLGLFILWFGWFGFNGGSLGRVDERLGTVLLNTHLGAAAGVAGALFTLIASGRPIYLTRIVNGCLGGLVSITAAATLISPGFAILAGAIGGAIVIGGGWLLERLRIDDVVGAVPVHAFCGVWGALVVGLFRSGDLFNPEQIAIQFVGALAAFLWAFPLAYILFRGIAAGVGLRSETLHEQRGLDVTEHAEVGYPEFDDQPLAGDRRR